ncbi:hypothetical protein PGH07_06075 [Sulfurovum sp. zt1-1]|uniref:Uncharacterized protein n=1 Tax=Sulfurovum zhangzhouensis TaxID=3019067 RepID=A0ABT7QY41_9BACT|nr:hypothetical protein [Sulfurovum zhangzhouensis]MDM5271736.1 hypothetical protein [Sulfurovum zhangzhouensis]
MIKTSISVIIVFSIIAAAIFFFLVDGVAEGLCGNKIYKEYLSPNNSLKAVIFQRECGPSNGATTQISVIETNQSLENKAGNIFVIKGEPNITAPAIEWNSDEEITIHHMPDGTEVKAKTQMMLKTPLKITYKE